MSLQTSSVTNDDSALSQAGDGDSSIAPVVLHATSGGTVTVPGGGFLLGAEFSRVGGDLVLTGPGGDPTVVIRDFFTVDNPPALTTENGAVVEAALAMHLAGVRAPGQYAASGDGDGEALQPVGRVAEINGEATATRVDGTKVTLTKDTPVYQGDIIETADGAALKVVFIDESTFSVGENGRMVLDEMVFDPSTLAGESTISVLQGVFVFVSGEIAANNPDQMAIRTPVATIGIRGTAVAIYAAQEGEQNKVVLLTEQATDGQSTTGAVTITNQGGTVVLDQAFETTLVESAFASPAPSYISSSSDLKNLVGQLGSAAPASVQYLSSATPSDQAGASANAGQNGAAAENTDPSDGAPKDAAQGESPGPTGEGGQPPDAPPPDAALFADEAGLFEDAALVVDGMLADAGKPPPGEAGPPNQGGALDNGPQLSLGGLSAMTDPALAQAVGAGVPAPAPYGAPVGNGASSFSSAGSFGAGAPASGYGASPPIGGPAANYPSGGFAGNGLGGLGGFGAIDSFAAGFNPNYAPPPITFSPPPPNPSIGGNGDQPAAPPPATAASNGVVLVGGSADESFFGTGFADTINGAGGNDSLFGFAGDDVLIGGAGNDLIDGGDGIDVVDYSAATSARVIVNLGAGTASSAESGTDSLIAIENVRGTHFNDTLTGSSGDNVIKSGGGTDLLVGGGGNDTYLVDSNNGGTVIVTINDSADSSTNDVLVMGSSTDEATPIDFDYTLSGGNLVVRHVLGNPSTEQGTIISFTTSGAIETFRFVDSSSTTSNLSLVLKTGGGSASGTSGSDFIAIADTNATTLDGGAGDDFLIGNSGSDIINGGTGNDLINGNGGGDVLDGGTGNDHYLVIPTSATTEAITDSAGTDTLEIGGIIGFKARNNGSDLILDFTNGTTVSVLNHFSGSAVEHLDIEESNASYLISTGTTGTAGDDLIAGGSGAQTIAAGAGDDLLFGDAGNDQLIGGAGNDVLVGGAGADILTGGAGAAEADHFRYFNAADGAAATNSTTGAQTGDQIADFQSIIDRFDFLNSAFGFASNDFTAVNGTTFFDVPGFNGTNASASGQGNGYFVFDLTSLTLYHDDGSNGTGYTVIATVQSGGTVASGDIHVSSLGGPSAY